MTIVGALKRLLEKAETIFLVLFLSIMLVFAFAQVILRDVFNTGLLWGDPLVREMVLWAGFVGAALAAGQERHISIDALTKFLSPRIKHVAAVLTNAFGAVVCWYLGRAAWGFMLEEKLNGGDMFLSLPSWVGLIIIPIGYWLITLHFTLNLVEHFLAALSHEQKEAA